MKVSPVTVRLPYPQLLFMNSISLGAIFANNCGVYSVAFCVIKYMFMDCFTSKKGCTSIRDNMVTLKQNTYTKLQQEVNHINDINNHLS